CLHDLSRYRMPGFVSCYFRLMLQSQPDVIQPFGQAMAGKVVDLESGGKSVVVFDCALLEVDGQAIVGQVSRTTRNFRDLLFAQNNREHAIFHAVIGKDVRERRSDDRPETKVLQGPNRVFARRSATEILPSHQNAGPGVAGLVQRKGWIVRTIFAAAPVVEQEFAES